METKSLKNAISDVPTDWAGQRLVGARRPLPSRPPTPAVGVLGAAATATDVYRLTCPIFTMDVSANVTDLIRVAAPLVSLQIFKRSRCCPAL